jgi:hypothetical protein
MRISADQIEDKGIAGKTEDGRPVVYILTKGGLHAFFVKTAEGIASIGAAPHLAIAKFLAGKKEKINWEEDFTKSEGLAKSEVDQFQKLRKMMFMPSFDKAVGPEDLLMVYNFERMQIDVLKTEDFAESDYAKSCLVRSCALTEPPVLIEEYANATKQS